MKRREFITVLGGAAAWPIAAHAQQPRGMRRIGFLLAYAESDPVLQSLVGAFVKNLQDLGWMNGRNVRIDYRWAASQISQMRTFAKELVELQPDAIVAHTTPVIAALQRETRKIPIVFVIVSDPVGAGFVASLPRPGGNITGFINVESSMGGKWLQLLKQIAPHVRRAAYMFNPETAPGGGSYFLASFQAAARSSSVEPISAAVRSDTDIKRVITDLGREPGAGLVVSPDAFLFVHRATIISLCAMYKVPAIYNNADYARDGALISYGVDNQDEFRRAAPYIDRILRGAKPDELPVQFPTKFVLVINLKTAKALSLDVPLHFQQLADVVIE